MEMDDYKHGGLPVVLRCRLPSLCSGCPGISHSTESVRRSCLEEGGLRKKLFTGWMDAQTKYGKQSGRENSAVPEVG